MSKLFSETAYEVRHNIGPEIKSFFVKVATVAIL